MPQNLVSIFKAAKMLGFLGIHKENTKMIRKTLHKKVILFSHFQVSGLKYMIFFSFINIDHLDNKFQWDE